MLNFLKTVASMFLGAFLALAAWVGIGYSVFVTWMKTPLDEPVTPSKIIHTLLALLGPDYLWLWGLAIAVFAIEGALIVYCLWPRKSPAGP